MKIAVVRNLSYPLLPGECGEPMPEVSTSTTAQVVAEALAEAGHSVVVCEPDARLLAVLERFMPFTSDGAVTGLVFNLARGGHGDACACCIPALLELARLPYTGPTPLGHATAFDTVLWRLLLRQSGVPVAPYDVLRWRGGPSRVLQFPVAATPRYRRPGLVGRVAWSRRELVEAVDAILSVGDQEVVVTEHLDGPEFSCALLGNGDDLELLPIIERYDAMPGDLGHPADVAPTPLSLRVGALAAAAFKASHCQDYGRVTIRLGRTGVPVVTDIDATPRLDRDGTFVLAAVAGAYGHADLVSRVLDIAHRRYFGVPAPRFDVGSRDRSQTSLLRVLGPTG